VPDNSDNLPHTAAEIELPAHRGVARPSLGEGFIYDHDSRSFRSISAGEVAACHKLNSHRMEVPWRNRDMINQEVIILGSNVRPGIRL
jgi:hypothetical protein